MHSRKKPLKSIWNITLNFTRQEKREYISAIESQQEKMVINKYCSIRGNAPNEAYLMIQRRLKDEFGIKQGLTVPVFRRLLKSLRQWDPKFKQYTHYAPRSKSMMKFFIHDFKDDINLFFQNYTYINNGWFPKENPVDTSEPNANGKQIKLKEQENDDQLFDCFWDETVLFGDFAENNILDDFDDMESLNCL